MQEIIRAMIEAGRGGRTFYAAIGRRCTDGPYKQFIGSRDFQERMRVSESRQWLAETMKLKNSVGQLADEGGFAGAVGTDHRVGLAFGERRSRCRRGSAQRAEALDHALTRRRESGIGLVEDAGEAAPKEDHRQDEERAEDHLPVLRPP